MPLLEDNLGFEKTFDPVAFAVWAMDFVSSASALFSPLLATLAVRLRAADDYLFFLWASS